MVKNQLLHIWDVGNLRIWLILDKSNSHKKSNNRFSYWDVSLWKALICRLFGQEAKRKFQIFHGKIGACHVNKVWERCKDVLSQISICKSSKKKLELKDWRKEAGME